MKKIMSKIMNVGAAIAIMFVAAEVNSACFFIIHQPKMPEAAKKLRKF